MDATSRILRDDHDRRLRIGAERARRAQRAPLRRVARVAASTYVVAWAVGLAIAPAGPDPLTATPAELHAHAAGHTLGLAAQSMLIHGVAGVALLTVALLLPGRLGNDRTARLARASGIVAATASFVQTGLMLAIVAGVPRDAAATVAGRFAAIDWVDSVKLLALGLMIGLFVRAGRRTVGRALVVFGTLVAVLLPVSGAAFVGADAMYPLLYVTLPLLLVWVAWFTMAVTRPIDRTGSAAR